MNILHHHVLDRRTTLKGLGVALSLPLLEAMLPGGVLRAAGAGSGGGSIPARSAFFYFGTGMNVRELFPKDTGKNFTMTPTIEPLAPWRDQFTFFSNTFLQHGGGHQGDYPFLTGADAGWSNPSSNTISADQVVANAIGDQTRFASLQFSRGRGTGFGSYLQTLSWTEAGVPLPAENDPSRIFARLFAPDDADSRARRANTHRQRGSILDMIADEAKSLETKIGKSDQEKLDEYFTSIRGVETQLERDIDWADKPKPEPKIEGMGDFSKSVTYGNLGAYTYEQYAKLMYDLIALAFQTDSTRTITYVVRQEGESPNFPEWGVSKGFHALTHHGEDPQNLRELAQVDRIYMSHFAYLLQRLSDLQNPDGSSLLDHTVLGFSSGMGIGHSKDRLPTAMFGGRALGVDHQGHLVLPPNTPLSAVWHTMVDRVGVQTTQFQDSPGVIKELIAA